MTDKELDWDQVGEILQKPNSAVCLHPDTINELFAGFPTETGRDRVPGTEVRIISCVAVPPGKLVAADFGLPSSRFGPSFMWDL